MADLTLAHASQGWLVLALGWVVFGLGGLLAKRPPSAPWRVAVATLLLAAAAAALVLRFHSSVALALLSLATLQAGLIATRAASVRRAGARLAAALTSPRLHALVLLVAGAGVAVWQASRLDAALERDMALGDEQLAALGEPLDLIPATDPVALTDLGNPVPLFASRVAGGPSAEVERAQVHRLGLDLQLIQTGAADLLYNCHGWVFADGRYWVRGEAVAPILKENGYKVVSQPERNDIAVFRGPGGIILHTALVRSISERGEVLLESKWGQLGRFLHTDTLHAYRHATCTYYRSSRPTHLLRGLEYRPAG